MREFWREALWYFGHPTEPYLSKEVVSSLPELTEAERMAFGLPIGHAPCVRFMQRCLYCDKQTDIMAPRSMLYALIRAAHYEGQHHAIVVVPDSSMLG